MGYLLYAVSLPGYSLNQQAERAFAPVGYRLFSGYVNQAPGSSQSGFSCLTRADSSLDSIFSAAFLSNDNFFVAV